MASTSLINILHMLVCLIIYLLRVFLFAHIEMSTKPVVGILNTERERKCFFCQVGEPLKNLTFTVRALVCPFEVSVT